MWNKNSNQGYSASLHGRYSSRHAVCIGKGDPSRCETAAATASRRQQFVCREGQAVVFGTQLWEQRIWGSLRVVIRGSVVVFFLSERELQNNLYFPPLQCSLLWLPGRKFPLNVYAASWLLRLERFHFAQTIDELKTICLQIEFNL